MLQHFVGFYLLLKQYTGYQKITIGNNTQNTPALK